MKIKIFLLITITSVLAHCNSNSSPKTAAEFAKSTFTSTRNNGLPADGTTKSTITFTLRNSNGDPVGGKSVTLSASGDQNTFSQATTSTDEKGEIKATLSTKQLGAKEIRATLDAGTANELLLSNFAVINFGNLFGAPRGFPAGGTPSGMTLGDFNGDGVTDIATANTGDNNVSILYATPLGSAGTVFGRLLTNVGQGPSSLAAGDFNGDGFDDLVVANSTDNTVSILINDGGGTFVQKQDSMNNFVYPAVAVGTTPQAIIAADVNGDDKLDFVTANTGSGSNEISVSLGNGKGGFAKAKNYNANPGLVSLVAGDFNGDGKMDLIVVSSTNNNLSYVQGDGSGGFTSVRNITSGAAPVYVAAGDLNGDGRLDIVVANNDTASPLTVHIGNGNGKFQSPILPSIGTVALNGVTIADFDGNGRPDVAFTETTGNLGVILGDGLGTFGAKATFGTNASNPRSVIGFDFNKDGIVEAVTANEGSGNVSVFNVPTDEEAATP